MKTWLAAVVLSGAMVSAAAGTIQGNAESCAYLAKSAQLLILIQMGDTRPWEEVKDEVRDAVMRGKARSDSYVLDSDDVEFAMKTFERVWRATSAEGLIEGVYRDCVRGGKTV